MIPYARIKATVRFWTIRPELPGFVAGVMQAGLTPGGSKARCKKLLPVEPAHQTDNHVDVADRGENRHGYPPAIGPWVEVRDIKGLDRVKRLLSTFSQIDQVDHRHEIAQSATNEIHRLRAHKFVPS
jgi:hypothetical protein